MTIRTISIASAILAAVTALPAMAEPSGDVSAGEKTFSKKCVTCHVVIDDAGEQLAGRKGKIGPNLYGIAMAPAAAVDGFRYGSGIQEAAEKGLIWDEASFIAYVKNPTGFLREFTGDGSARSKMSFKVKSDEEAADLYALLYSYAPPAE